MTLARDRFGVAFGQCAASPTSADHGYRALRVGADVLADRAEHQPGKAAVTALADHQQVGVRR